MSGATKVLFIAHDSGLFGAQRTLLTLLQKIDKQKFKCRVVIPEKGPFTVALEAIGIPYDERHMVRWVPEVSVANKLGRWKCLWRVISGLRERAWAIARLVERFEIDLVYTNTVTCIEGAIAARMAHVPHVWHVHEPIGSNPELGGLLPDSLYAKTIGSLSSRVIFCSGHLAACYPSLSKKSVVVPNGLPIPATVDRAYARSSLVSHLGLATSSRVVAIVGAIQPRKDHRTFLMAAARVAAHRADVAFVISGSGSAAQTAALHEQIAQLGLQHAVHVLGWWTGPIHDLLAAADTLVISSIQESFGLSAIEALSVRTPVVSTRCGGPEEILRDGIDGLLVPVGGVAEMADAIQTLLNDPAKARALGSAGRENVITHFSVDRYVSALQNSIVQAVAER